MLTREHRLKKFQNVYQQGRKVPGKYMVIQFVGKPDGILRCGFAVARKISTKPKKNRIKRQLRSICRKHLGNNRDGMELVITAFSNAVGVTFQDLERDYLRTIKRAGLFKSTGI
jgi:ribonuclease P protein component